MKVVDIVFDSGSAYTLYCTDYGVSNGVAVFRKYDNVILTANFDKIRYIQEK